jgi:2-oxoisovalerate dehydrogenase E2 component (dihydrolipoyl transacylase)
MTMGRYVFKLPDVGEGTAEAEIVAWHVAVGDRVREDQQLVDVMTDKATVEMTSPVAGTVVALKGTPGEMAAVGAPLVEFELEGVETKPVKGERSGPRLAANDTSKHVVNAAEPAKARVLAAPAVRLRAVDLGIELAQVRGTGPGGRVTHGDVDDYLSSSSERKAPRPRTASHVPGHPGGTEFEEVKLVGLRRRIAEKMQEAKRRIPHFAYVEEIDMTELERLRAHLNETRTADQPKLTVLPFLMRALVRVLPKFPHINAHFDDESATIRHYRPVHIGIATQTEAGLLVPVVRNAERLDLWQAAAEVARVAGQAREHKASKSDLGGSTITITSLGPLGGLVTTPIINHPETAIIGPNAIVERPVVFQGQIAVRKMMNLSSCFDHRVVDGADAARFVRALKEILEHPALLFLEQNA